MDDGSDTVTGSVTAVHAELGRGSTFLGEASTALLGSLNPGRCMEIAAALATDHLCDVAVVMAPAAGGRHPRVSSVRGGEVVHDSAAVDPAAVPGLAERCTVSRPCPRGG